MASDPEFDAEYQKELKRLKAEARAREQEKRELIERSRRRSLKEKAKRKAAKEFERSEKRANFWESESVRVFGPFVIPAVSLGLLGLAVNFLSEPVANLKRLGLFIYAAISVLLWPISELIQTLPKPFDLIATVILLISIIYFGGNYLVSQVRRLRRRRREKKDEAKHQQSIKSQMDEMITQDGKAKVTPSDIENLDSIFGSKEPN